MDFFSWPLAGGQEAAGHFEHPLLGRKIPVTQEGPHPPALISRSCPCTPSLGPVGRRTCNLSSVGPEGALCVWECCSLGGTQDRPRELAGSQVGSLSTPHMT